jgi:hypothetical protein
VELVLPIEVQLAEAQASFKMAMELSTEAKLGEMMRSRSRASDTTHEVGDEGDWASPDAGVHTPGWMRGCISRGDACSSALMYRET